MTFDIDGVRRRTVLRAAGVAATGGALSPRGGARPAQPPHFVRQGPRCVPIRPLAGDVPVEELYSYQLPERFVSRENGGVDDGGPYFAAAGLEGLKREDTTITFLYDGPEGLSLVVVHDTLGESPNGGGSVTWTITGLPEDGRWVVKDDLYRTADGAIAPSNYDRWALDGPEHVIHWTWGDRTDGGVFRGLGEDVRVRIEPAFNENARLQEPYEGRITDWQVLSGSLQDPRRISLAIDEPVTIQSGSCRPTDVPPGQAGDEREDEDEDRGRGRERREEARERREERREEREERREERRERREERREERQERREERREEREERREERRDRGEDGRGEDGDEREDEDDGGDERGGEDRGDD